MFERVILSDPFMIETDKTLALAAVDELRHMQQNGLPDVTPDIQMVWSLSAPGSYLEVPGENQGSYCGIDDNFSFDRHVIDWGVGVITAVTALRLDKPVSEVSQADIAEAGPLFFYNGEDKETENVNWHQNEHLTEAIEKGICPLPRSRVIIERISQIATPGQVVGMGEFLKANPDIQKVAVVSNAPHSVRVGRYIQHYRDKGVVPENVTFVNAAASMYHFRHFAVNTSLREVRKVVQYANAGHLARKNYFYPDSLGWRRKGDQS